MCKKKKKKNFGKKNICLYKTNFTFYAFTIQQITNFLFFYRVISKPRVPVKNTSGIWQ